MALVMKVLSAENEKVPTWLERPGRPEALERWELIRQIYSALAGLELPETMPPRETRRLDAVIVAPDGSRRILEVDEKQHFNQFRESTLSHYPPDLQLAFSRNDWVERCRQKTRLEGGGFSKPRPPLFPGPNGRHRQRAFRDALCDIIPPLYGFLPTLRIADFEVQDWVFSGSAESQMRALLHLKGVPTLKTAD